MAKARLFLAPCLLSAASLYFLISGSSYMYNAAETTKEKASMHIEVQPFQNPPPTETTKEKAWHIQIQPFQNPPPRECCPFAQQVYANRYGGARCCTDRLDTLEDLREESLSLESFGVLQNTTILLQGDSLAEQHFIGLLCFSLRYGDLQTNLTLVHVPNPDLLHKSGKAGKSGTIWQATILPLNISIKFLRWDNVQVCPTERYQEDFVILGGWHHDNTYTIQKAMGPFLEHVQSLRIKQQHTTILNEALPAHFPGGKYLQNNPNRYPPPTVLTKYYSTNNHTPTCDSSTNQGNPNANRQMKTWAQQYNMTYLPVFDIYRDRGDAHVNNSTMVGRDCLHWCVEALDAWALKTWYLLATLKHSSSESDIV